MQSKRTWTPKTKWRRSCMWRRILCHACASTSDEWRELACWCRLRRVLQSGPSPLCRRVHKELTAITARRARSIKQKSARYCTIALALMMKSNGACSKRKMVMNGDRDRDAVAASWRSTRSGVPRWASRVQGSRRRRYDAQVSREVLAPRLPLRALR